MKRIKIVWGQTAIVIVLAGIALNLIGVRLATAFGWLLFLDSVGTILAAALGGILPGILVGFLSNAINSVADPITLYYGIVSVLLAVCAYILAQKGAFRRLWTSLLCVIPFSLIGGGLGSLLTWLLYGFNFGSGISAPLAAHLHENMGMAKFTAQLLADMGVDVLDKLVAVVLAYLVLRYLPQKLLNAAPCGELFGRRAAAEGRLSRRRTRGRSLRNTVAMIIALTAFVLTALSFAISSSIYKNTMNARYISIGQSACNMVRSTLSAGRMDEYLAQGERAETYLETQRKLQKIKNCFPDVEYLYVYQIREDGCHVVFDLDTDELTGGDPGDVVPFEPAFAAHIPALLAGEEIEPIISNDDYGWLLTIYQPVRTITGRCTAYAAVDISMEAVIADRYVFAIRLISLMFGASILIIALAIWYTQKRVVEPIDTLTAAAGHFAFEGESERKENTEEIRALNIHTRDEIEELYRAISQTVTDMAGYMDQAAASAAFISRLQDNIILSFADMVENRDENTGSHIKRTAAYVRAIGAELLRRGLYSDTLTETSLANIVKSAPLHDIGKIKIPDSILNKPGRLTREEFEVIKTHTTEGRKILMTALNGIEGSGYLSEAMDMAAYHHEWWNGSGYPEGKRGEEIPLCARLMAVADVFDALMAKRSYKSAIPFAESVRILQSEAGSHFDPAVVEAFSAILPEIQALSEQE